MRFLPALALAAVLPLVIGNAHATDRAGPTPRQAVTDLKPLLARAAAVCFTERRRVVLLVRETPLNLAHIRHMETVTLMGGVIFPPVPALYQRPESIEQMVDHTLARVLDLFDIPNALAPRWSGMGESAD
jgi:polyprenyl P-hydroxybenzoate/phenylacrylic acid decarboxylase-like protein